MDELARASARAPSKRAHIEGALTRKITRSGSNRKKAIRAIRAGVRVGVWAPSLENLPGFIVR